jgi:hypothetical protein
MKWGPVLLAAACGSTVAPPGLLHRTGLMAVHVTTCNDDSICGDGLEPPLGGPHCPSTLSCRIYDTPQLRCEYIHNLEHGHLVLAYNCAAPCDDVIAALSAFQRESPRSLVTPDPKLKTRVAAMVWGWGWAGDSVDLAMLRAVRMKQDVDAPEAGLGCAP